MQYLLLSLLTLACVALSARAADLPDADKLPAQKELPDPLVMRDGTRVKTAADWNKKRRPELKKLIQHYMYGPLPAAPKKVTAKVEREDAKALGGKATLREVTLTVAPAPAPKLHLLLVIPNKRPAPVGMFAGLNFSGNHTLVDDDKVRIPTTWMYPRYPGVKGNKATAAGRGTAKDVWAIEQTIDRGYAVATVYNGDIDPDRKDERGELAEAIDKDGKSGRIALWAWGVHRIVDYLLTVEGIDPKRIIAVGHSRLGKTALLAAAYDDRIALSIPHQAGCGGSAPSRGKVGESVKAINTNFPRWFNAEFKKFNAEPERLPFDQHSLTALVAPRPVLFSNAEKDTWANPKGQFEVLKAAEPVYKLLKAGGLASKEVPEKGVLSAGTLGYYIRAGEHSMTKEDWKVFLDFADKHLKAKEKKATKRARKVLLVSQGPDGHPFGTHEYVSGLKVLASCLKDVKELELMHARADGAWKEGPELIDRMDGVVLFLAEGAKWLSRDEKRLRAMRDLAKRGGGMVALHWAMGTKDAKPIDAFVDLFGACHGGPDRKYKFLTTDVKVVAPKHAIMRGIKDMRLKDEFYYRLKVTKAAKAVTPLLTAAIDDEDHMVAWAYARPGGGRAFGFSGLHYHENWKREEYRRMVSQGVLWSVGLEVPAGGMKVPLDEKAMELKKGKK